MNLQPVNPEPACTLTCYSCGQSVSSREAMADLDGPAFKAYYCRICAAGKRMRFTADDAGCWIDGTYGMPHAISVLVGLLEAYVGHDAAGIVRELRSGILSDDHSEFDDAADLLQACCDDGLIFWWHAGNLLLTTESEAENA